MKTTSEQELNIQRQQQLVKQQRSAERGDCKYHVVAEMFLAQYAKDSLSTDGGTADDGYANVERLFKVAQQYSGMSEAEFEEFITYCLREYRNRK